MTTLTIHHIDKKIMKRQLLSPLCSALIVPGLGQILNHRLKKGIIILGLVFLLFIIVIVTLTYKVLSLLEGQALERVDSVVILQHLREGNFSFLWFPVIAFGIVWLYSVLDAFLEGGKIDKGPGGDFL